MQPSKLNMLSNILVVYLSVSVAFMVSSSAKRQPQVASIKDESQVSSPDENNVLLLLPAAYNASNLDMSADFNLFKLNTIAQVPSLEQADAIKPEPKETTDSRREGRKISLLGNMWNKPKFSPLYLVNGTVCRFINSSPICTTLSTTGLLPLSTTARPLLNNNFNGQNQNGQTFNQNGQNANLPNANGNFANLNQNQPSNNNNNNNNQFQNFRQPAALSDEEAMELNVEGVGNSTDGSARVVQNSGIGTGSQPVSSGQVSRPAMITANRRPLNSLLSLRRPLRNLSVKKRADD